MTVRVAAAAALGALLLAGCSSTAQPAPTPSPSATSSDLTGYAQTVRSTCENMDVGGTPTSLAQWMVDRGVYKDLDTAKYEVRRRVQDGCPQYLTRP
jgi:PBP1b-binding outer membrane lipoprotein LpoB